MFRSAKRLVRDQAYSLITNVWGDNEGYVTLPVLKGPAQGLRFRLDIQTRREAAYCWGYYDLHVLQAIAQVCKPGWVIWDCGIYLGFYTAFFARLTGPSGRVVAFEPDPNNLVRTRANVALNSLHNVDFVHAAIGAPASEATFILSANSNSHLPGTYVGADTNSYASIEQQATTIQVRCLGLDQAIASEHIRPPQLIKIDIEGAELEALSYMHELVQQYRPLIVLELHNPQCDAAAWEFAQRENYTLTSLETGEIIRRQEDVHGTLLCSHN